LHVDKRPKIDRPFETIYSSHKPRPIKVVDTALSETAKADEIASKTAKTGKVTAVVLVMRFFRKKDVNCGALVSEIRGHLAKRQKEPIFLQENARQLRSLSQKLRKGWIPKKLVPKSKKLELNCTNLMLNSKNTRSDCAKMPNPGISSGLYVKIRQ
jgi:hypothetical protein